MLGNTQGLVTLCSDAGCCWDRRTCQKLRGGGGDCSLARSWGVLNASCLIVQFCFVFLAAAKLPLCSLLLIVP